MRTGHAAHAQRRDVLLDAALHLGVDDVAEEVIAGAVAAGSAGRGRS